MLRHYQRHLSKEIMQHVFEAARLVRRPVHMAEAAELHVSALSA
jgi:hypothetical protein